MTRISISMWRHLVRKHKHKQGSVKALQVVFGRHLLLTLCAITVDAGLPGWSRMTGCCSGPGTTPCPALLTPLSPAYTQALVEPPHCWVNVVFGQESSALWAFRWIIYLILFIHAMKHKILYVFRGSESAHLYPF